MYPFYLDIIDNIADHVDLTRDQMARQTTQINLVERKDRTCGKLSGFFIF